MRIPMQAAPVDRLRISRGIEPQSIACVTGTIENGSICVDLPFLGKKCIDVGLNFVNGLSASVCLESLFPPKVCANVAGSRFCI